MKFKKGDKVRVKTNLQAGKKYPKCTFREEMTQNKGKTFVISKVIKDFSVYRLKGIEFYYSDDMLEKPNNSIRRIE